MSRMLSVGLDHSLMVSFSIVLVKQSLDTVAVIRVNISEILHSSFLDEDLGILQVTGDVLTEPLALFLTEHFGVKVPDLGDVVIIRAVVAGNICRHPEFALPGRRLVLWGREAVGEIIGSSPLIIIEAHWAIALVVAHSCFVRAVHR